MKILSKILNNKDITNKEYVDTETSALEQRISALENDRRNSEVPIGTIIAYSSSTAPDGYLKCEGQAISRTDYSQLFAAIGTTYGVGDGSTTFNLPDLTDKFLKGSTTAGTVEQAGLPNITGSFYAYGYSSRVTSGSFSATQSAANRLQSGNSNGYDYNEYSFSAKNSNSIYGNSNTVTPANTSVVYCIKYRSPFDK